MAEAPPAAPFEAGVPEPMIVKVLALDASPNQCRLSDPLTLTMQYYLAYPVEGAIWELVFEADFTNKRKAVVLYQSPPEQLTPGQLVFQHSMPYVNVEGIKEKYLLQMGVLKLTLHSSMERDLVSVNTLVQVTKDPTTGDLIRTLIPPEE